MNDLTKAIQVVVFGQPRTKLDELILEYESLAFRREESVASVLASHCEGEARLI